jgi:transcriptional regulator with XRE-family HTH domain
MAPSNTSSVSKDTNIVTNEASQGPDLEFVSRLKDAMKKSGMSAARLSDVSGVSHATIRGNLQGKIPNAKSLFMMARSLQVHPEWLALGFGYAGPYGRGPRYVPKYSLQLSAGHGTLEERSDLLGLTPFNGDFLYQLGSENQNDFAILGVVGDSMEPTIKDGAEVLIDVRPQQWGDGIWAFAFGDALRIKRLRRGLKSLQVISDNPAYPPEEITEHEESQLNLIGRVRWVGQTL